MKTVKLLLFLLLFVNCNKNSKTNEVRHDKRDNVVNVKDQIQAIHFDEEDVLIGRYAPPHILDSYLIVGDAQTYEYGIHIFDKESFKYICSTGLKGEGPNEITNFSGVITVDEHNDLFYVIDTGKRKILTFDIDSLFNNPQEYHPFEKYEMDTYNFPIKMQILAGNEVYASTIIASPEKKFDMATVKMNLETGEMQPLPYTHPEIELKRADFYASASDGIGIETYSHHDLMTIHDLEKGLKCNVYGPDWDNKTSNKRLFYGRTPLVVRKHIVVDYSFGRDRIGKDSEPTSLLVFDLDGNYIKTLELGYKIIKHCFDKENGRLIFNFDDADVQFGYLDLEGLI